jgi:AbrB family looped-hinge helix DNA binding protein
METTLSSKGQIVIPKRIRESHGWRPGTTFILIEEDNGLYLKPASSRKTTTIEEVIGCAGYSGPKKSIKEMDAAIVEEAKRQAESWSR